MSHSPYESPEEIYQLYTKGHLAPDVALHGLDQHYKDIDEFITSAVSPSSA